MSTDAAVSTPVLLTLEILQPRVVGGTRPWLIFLSTSGNDDAYFYALSKALGPDYPMGLARPSFFTYGHHFYAIEKLTADVAACIRCANLDGHYVMGGFCFGGMLAYAYAQTQVPGGACLGLVTWDMPMPGFPQFLPTLRAWPAYRRIFRRLAAICRAPGVRLAAYLVCGTAAWHILLRSRPLLVRYATLRPVRYLAFHQQKLSLMRVRPMRLPMLVLVAEKEGDPAFSLTLNDWHLMAADTYEEHTLPGRHYQMFAAPNTERSKTLLVRWLDVAMNQHG